MVSLRLEELSSNVLPDFDSFGNRPPLRDEPRNVITCRKKRSVFDTLSLLSDGLLNTRATMNMQPYPPRTKLQ